MLYVDRASTGDGWALVNKACAPTALPATDGRGDSAPAPPACLRPPSTPRDPEPATAPPQWIFAPAPGSTLPPGCKCQTECTYQARPTPPGLACCATVRDCGLPERDARPPRVQDAGAAVTPLTSRSDLAALSFLGTRALIGSGGVPFSCNGNSSAFRVTEEARGGPPSASASGCGAVSGARVTPAPHRRRRRPATGRPSSRSRRWSFPSRTPRSVSVRRGSALHAFHSAQRSLAAASRPDWLCPLLSRRRLRRGFGAGPDCVRAVICDNLDAHRGAAAAAAAPGAPEPAAAPAAAAGAAARASQCPHTHAARSPWICPSPFACAPRDGTAALQLPAPPPPSPSRRAGALSRLGSPSASPAACARCSGCARLWAFSTGGRGRGSPSSSRTRTSREERRAPTARPQPGGGGRLPRQPRIAGMPLVRGGGCPFPGVCLTARRHHRPRHAAGSRAGDPDAGADPADSGLGQRQRLGAAIKACGEPGGGGRASSCRLKQSWSWQVGRSENRGCGELS